MKKMQRLVQDGRVKGHLLTSSYKSIKVTTIIRILLKHTKKLYPMSKDKREAPMRWSSVAIINQVSYRLLS